MKIKRKQGWRALLASFAMVLMLSSCKNVEASIEQELRLATPSPMNTLSHIINTEAVNSQVIESFLEGLLTYDEKRNLIGSMAERWEASSDNLTYTFRIRDGVEWSNGSAVTAHDFVFGWQTLATDSRAGYVQMLVDANIQNAAAVIAKEKAPNELGVFAKSDKELVVQLDAPCVFFEQLMAFGPFFPINERFYNSIGGASSFGTSIDTVLSNGPFVLTAWQPDTEYVLEKNERYWNATNVRLTKVSTRVVREHTTRATLYDNGEIDRLALVSDIFERYEGNPNLVRQQESSWFHMYLSGNNGPQSAALKNKNFRAAVAHAIDKTILTDQILKNGALPANYLVPKNFDKIGNTDFRAYANQFNASIYNPDKARAYFSQAKEELGDADFSFEFVISDDQTSKKMFENVKAQIEDVLDGVKFELRMLPSNTFFNVLKDGNTNVSYGGWSADYVDVDTYFSIFRTNDAHNYGRWSNAAYDKLLSQASKELDKRKRWDYFVQAEKILIEDYSIIPLYQRGSLAVMNPKIKGYTLNPVSPEVFFKYVYFE